MVEAKDYNGAMDPTWCPGCGNFGILAALKRALAEADLEPHQVQIVSGIGCGSKMPHYMKVNGFHTLHGRAVAVATGALLANHGKKVIVVHGDGDSYGMGGNHFIHAARRNIGLVDLVQNNRVYGLTKGQYSPTSPAGFVSKTSPEGAIDQPINPLSVALAAGATFVARAFPLDMAHFASLIRQAMDHPGYALIDTLQVCVSFNPALSYPWYRQRVYKLDDEEGYDEGDLGGAMARALEWGDRIPVGVLYRDADAPSYEAQLSALADGPLVDRPLRPMPIEDYESVKREFI
jgi:2-oxoglutarate/2-oxoacid ferredoxin oxidoreductase subunit beta